MDLFLFDKNKEVIDIITPDSIYESEQTNELNGLITHTVSGVYTDAVEDAEFFGMKDVDDNGIFWRYKVSGLRKADGHFTLDGTYELFDDLKSRTIIQDKRPQSQSALNALNTLLEGTTWEVGIVSSERVATSNWYYISPLEAFWDYLEKWNVEFKPRMIYSGGKVIRKVIDISDRLSDDYGKWYEYGSDLLTVVAEEDKANIYTAFVGRGKGEETDAGGYGRRLTIEDVEWSTANGDPVDKPLGQNYIEILEATALYGYEDGTPRVTTVTFEDIDDRNELIRATYDYAVQEARPKAQFKATVHEDGAAEVGEIVTIIRDDLNIRYKTRVFKLTRNFLNKRIKQLEFGDELVQSRAKQSKAIADRFNKKIEETNVFWLDALREAITDSYFNNDGYNYDLQADNEYGLPGGYYSFDRPIEENPTKAIYMGAGNLLISNEKNPNGEWVWRTALNGEGIMADWIVGQNSEFVRSSWNSIDSNVSITGDGILSRNNDDSFYTRTTSGLIHFGDDLNTTVGSMGSMVREGSNTIRGVGIYIEDRKEFGVAKRWSPNGPYEYIMRSAINSRGLDIFAPTTHRATLNLDNNAIHDVDRIYFGDTTEGLIRDFSDNTNLLISRGGVRLGVGSIAEGFNTRFLVYDSRTRVMNNLEVEGKTSFMDTVNFGRNQLHDVDRIYMNGTTNGLRTSGGRPFLDGHIGVYLAYEGNMMFDVQKTLVRTYGNLDMNGHEIINQSDIRLKTNVEDSSLDALGEIERMRFIEFDWDKENLANKGKPDGRQFGIVAQYNPFLQTKAGDSESYLSVDVTKQINLNSKANQELLKELKKTKQELNETKQELADLKALLTEKGLI